MSTTANLLGQAILERELTTEGKPRRIGIEIEFAGLDAQTIVEIMQRNLAVTADWTSPFEIDLEHQEFGAFKLELDSKQVKELGVNSKVTGNPSDAEPGFDRAYIETVSRLAENLVPWEIVSPPLPLAALSKLYPLMESLREAGALGTKAAMRYAFGVHLNPEPVDLEPSTILNHIRSFMCLYDWISKVSNIDVSRKLTPYINHFGQDYILKVIDTDYQPSVEELIDDYLEFNPTRNRGLDMLPMFAHLDEERVRAVVDDDRIKPRPTFHYRLPNCEIDNPEWNLHRPLEIWMAIEEFAGSDRLADVCDEYQSKLDALMPIIGSSWVDRLVELLPLPDAESWKQDA